MRAEGETSSPVARDTSYQRRVPSETYLATRAKTPPLIAPSVDGLLRQPHDPSVGVDGQAIPVEPWRQPQPVPVSAVLATPKLPQSKLPLVSTRRSTEFHPYSRAAVYRTNRI
jgi:hypothetical protein